MCQGSNKNKPKTDQRKKNIIIPLKNNNYKPGGPQDLASQSHQWDLSYQDRQDFPCLRGC